jgi:hypothetical protein
MFRAAVPGTSSAVPQTPFSSYGKPGVVVVSADWYQDAADCLEQLADGPGRDQEAQSR